MKQPVAFPSELPRFISCKPVHALKISAITEAPIVPASPGALSFFLHFEYERFPARQVSADWLFKRGAKAGGYLVVYADGYESWAPADVFEAGSVPAEAWGLSRMQCPKYTISLRGQIVKRRDGNPLPPDEPLFILRGQDLCALHALHAYVDALPVGSPAREAVHERLLAFSAFRAQHPERMKDPDSPPPPPPVPTSIARWAPGEREGREFP